MKTLMLIMALGLMGGGALFVSYTKLKVDARSTKPIPVSPSPVVVNPYNEPPATEYDIPPSPVAVAPSSEPTGSSSNDPPREVPLAYDVKSGVVASESVDGCIRLDNFVDMWQAGGSIYQPFVIHLTNSCDFPVDTRMSITFYDYNGTRIGGTNIYVDNIPAKGRASEEAMALHLPEAKYEYSFTNVLSR
jgi:hypothetical protein